MSELAHFPRAVRASSCAPERIFVRRDDLYAVPLDRVKQHSSKRLIPFGGSDLALVQGEPAPKEQVYAVYSHGDTLAVATGKVFVRFAEGEQAVNHIEDLRRVGYEIVEVPVYALNAAWVSARDHDPASALRHIPDLEQLPGVENVEPELIAERGLRI